MMRRFMESILPWPGSINATTDMVALRLILCCLKAKLAVGYTSNMTAGKGKFPVMDKGVEAAVEAAGGVRPLARLLGISHQAIVQWDRVPAARLLEVERLTRVPREDLRPDLFRRARRATA
jgi:hypothetical protein